jgi:hypothetical protein
MKPLLELLVGSPHTVAYHQQSEGTRLMFRDMLVNQTGKDPASYQLRSFCAIYSRRLSVLVFRGSESVVNLMRSDKDIKTIAPSRCGNGRQFGLHRITS